MNTLKNTLSNIAFSRRTFTFLSLIAVLVFTIKALSFLDPDFGWHLKMGEYIKNFGIPKTDPFSYTMSSFPFIDHEWLINIFMHTLFVFIGMTGLAILFSLVGVCAILISVFNPLSRKSNKRIYAKYILLFVLAVGTVIPYVGVRPQLISWLYLSVLLFILLNQKIWNRFKFVLPPFLLLWVNTHGSFGAGLMILFSVLFLRMIRMRRVLWTDIVVCVLSLGVTFLTPYGFGNWREFLQQGGDISIHWTISEWMPSIFDFNITYIMLACLSSFFLLKYRKKFLLEEHGLYVVLLLEAISATRHVPLWSVFALPITSVGLDFLCEEIKNVPHGLKRLRTVYMFAFWLFFTIVSIAVFIRIHDSTQISETNYYPKDAVVYLRNNVPSQNLFSEYVWGGYLDWKLSEKKVFMDGRMATWKWYENPKSEDGYIFDIYQKLHTGDIHYKDVFNKYNVTTALLPKHGEEKNMDSFFPKLQNYLNQIIGRRNKDFSLMEELENDGWKKIYEDEVSVIYEKPQ